MNKQPHSALPNSMCPYEVLFGREPRWEHRVPTHLRHKASIDQLSISDSDSDSDEHGTDDDDDDDAGEESLGFDSSTKSARSH